MSVRIATRAETSTDGSFRATRVGDTREPPPWSLSADEVRERLAAGDEFMVFDPSSPASQPAWLSHGPAGLAARLRDGRDLLSELPPFDAPPPRRPS